MHFYLCNVLTAATLVNLSQAHNKQQPIVLGSPGIDQPSIGFGTWNLKESPENTTNAVAIAIEVGYRQIDCAAAYGNEKEVGKGIAKGLNNAGIERSEIWVTSKLWNDHHEPSRVEAALNQTLRDLGLDYLDLYLMHWPVGKGPHDRKYHYDYVGTWAAMVKLLGTGRVRHIGVSNFSPAQLKHIFQNSKVKPAVHQMELHPYLTQTDFVHAHLAHGIQITAYSPLGNMNPTYGDRTRRAIKTQSKAPLLLENKIVVDIAGKRGCTPAQVVLAWGMSRGVSVIPKSKHEAYIRENIEAETCVLVEDDLGRIASLGERPVRFNNPGDAWGVRLFEGLEDA